MIKSTILISIFSTGEILFFKFLNLRQCNQIILAKGACPSIEKCNECSFLNTTKRTLNGLTGCAWVLTTLPNGDLVKGSIYKLIEIWSINNGTFLRTIVGNTDLVLALTTLPDGDLVSGSMDKMIKIWNPNAGTLKQTLNGHTGPVRALTILQNGDLVSGSEDSTIKIWNPNDWKLR